MQVKMAFHYTLRLPGLVLNYFLTPFITLYKKATKIELIKLTLDNFDLQHTLLEHFGRGKDSYMKKVEQ